MKNAESNLIYVNTSYGWAVHTTALQILNEKNFLKFFAFCPFQLCGFPTANLEKKSFRWAEAEFIFIEQEKEHPVYCYFFILVFDLD